jgi:hypothetical protein
MREGGIKIRDIKMYSRPEWKYHAKLDTFFYIFFYIHII